MRLMPVLLSLLMTTAFLSGCIGNEPEIEVEPEVEVEITSEFGLLTNTVTSYLSLQ